MVITDLDEDTLSKLERDSTCHRFATEAIRGLRKNHVDNLRDLLTILGPRSTSWPRDMERISALLVGTPKASEEKQHAVYPQVLLDIGEVAHGHLFHRSATMTGHFSWCAAKLLTMSIAPQTQEQLRINYNGALESRWRVIKQRSVPRERYVLHNGFPLVDMIINVTLETADRSVLLGEPAAKVLDDTHHHYEFMGPETVNYVTIGGSQEETDSREISGYEISAWFAHFPPSYIKPHNPMNVDTYTTGKERLLLSAMEGDSDRTRKVLHKELWMSLSNWLDGTALCSAKMDELGQHCIHLAAEHGDSDLLIDFEEFLTGHKVCKDGQTALHRAILAGLWSWWLLDELGDNLKDVQDFQGRTALHLSAGLGLGKIFTELLTGGANHLLTDNIGRTALHYAALDWNEAIDTDIISTLLDYGELNVPDKDGRTPLHYATENECPAYVKVLVQNKNLAIVDSRGETALHVAVTGGYIDAVKEMLGQDLECLELPQIVMDTILSLAASINYLEVVQALVNHGTGIWYCHWRGNKTAVEWQ
ncbi:ankyrin repeat-containing protein, putative [Talaromyces stipitatus ATCC 10500]|uniref:Ankyrin repeat-containing protein, putative n=1 Tax=Talaromyces stipitatus (strain ATCC 10500 / CBS 375.48 / QM 6759 / NRRL 1006) TaxID=441959 RepID=B8MF65_TALSN|nr:ankyrin repeat-containing protein, putative [Talaromyces stipitatus ATCC 10500]EED16164.1 ankyrin repeat-containing protein, putative [Talaromyces stipitatus ATCC 10500]